MIRGLNHFKEYFRDFSSDFILVGGVASYLLLDEAGAPKIRPTKDLDIVLIMKPSDEFLKAIRNYINEAGYEIEKGDVEQSIFYRFQKPKSEEYPEMLEFFAVAESNFELFENQRIIPITTPAEVESLSAILLDEEYYSLIIKHAVLKDGMNVLNHLALIPLKAKAYLDIKDRKEDSKKWKKHRTDIINLTVAFLDGEKIEKLTGDVKDHFTEFVQQLKKELNPDIIKGACNQKINADEIISLLENTFL